jgi:hypothetical protein
MKRGTGIAWPPITVWPTGGSSGRDSCPRASVLDRVKTHREGENLNKVAPGDFLTFDEAASLMQFVMS